MSLLPCTFLQVWMTLTDITVIINTSVSTQVIMPKSLQTLWDREKKNILTSASRGSSSARHMGNKYRSRHIFFWSEFEMFGANPSMSTANCGKIWHLLDFYKLLEWRHGIACMWKSWQAWEYRLSVHWLATMDICIHVGWWRPKYSYSYGGQRGTLVV